MTCDATSLPESLLAGIEQVCGWFDAADLSYGHGTDNPWDEAVQLVLYAAGLPMDAGREDAERAPTSAQWQRVCALAEQRIQQRLPLPYLTGRIFFAGLQLKVDRRALVPRSPIAELVSAGFRPWWQGSSPTPRVLDLCAGGGAIGLACAHHLPGSRVDLADIDAEALALAADNAAALSLQARVSLLQGDLFGAVPGQCYDLVVSNPPYVDADDLATMPAEYHAEPPIGLGAGSDGLDIARRIIAQAADHLREDGILVLEVGNSWESLEAAFPQLPFTWLEMANGGHGVAVLSRVELLEAARSS